MRRIPRASRSIDPSITSSSIIHPRISPVSALRCAHPSPLVRTTSACFSTSTRCHNILGGTQDKKKHQQFVRRWQKRLLGDSEPIGAHVDPYDATSPVRISPEEQGEEVELLEETSSDSCGAPYRPAQTGKGLLRVGGKQWIEEREEDALLQRFNKLVAPREFGYGNVKYDFAPQQKVKKFRDLQAKFHQAVVEIYTLKQARLDAKFPSHVELDAEWTEQVKIHTSPAGGVVLSNALPEDIEEFLSAVKEPVVEAVESVDEFIIEEANDKATEVARQLAELAEAEQEGEKPKTKVTPTKKAEGKAFDFMSNRPVPRGKPEEPAIEVEQVVEEVDGVTKSSINVVAVHESIERELSTHRHDVLSAAATFSEKAIAGMRSEVHGTSSFGVSEAKYREIPLNDVATKFAIAKRVLQITGHRIPDPAFNASRSLGDLYSAFIAATRPTPTTVRDALKHEAKLQHVRSKFNKQTKTSTKAGSRPTLSSLPNVRFQGKRITPMQKEREVGRWKVIEYALAERNLPRFAKDA